MQEIERKFKVKSAAYKAYATQRVRLTQGYLSSVPERTVRVRLKGDEAFITIKGSSNESGTTRFEWEKAIAIAEAEQLLALCEKGVIDKTRYLVPSGNLCFEVDEFHGDNEGLVIAEIELPTEDTPFERPEWLGEEVTHETRYYNAMLSKKPFKNW
ncbi:MAG: CYTH domain-containing protein [Capnocytophaga sp.]|jgi:adenylate cyclase|uniref:CYTH domain-containing protein n=1 Tax=Capnocytophaga sp. TaxID=44737 RepID=UPI003FA0B6F0